MSLHQRNSATARLPGLEVGLAAGLEKIRFPCRQPAGYSPSGKCFEIKTLKARWTEASAQQAVTTWLQLSTSRNAQIHLIGCQNDLMAMGARKAFQQLTNMDERDRWMKLPFTGCDGLPKGGQEWVRKGLLAATVIVPANSKPALELLVSALKTGTTPPERTVISALPFPPVPQN